MHNVGGSFPRIVLIVSVPYHKEPIAMILPYFNRFNLIAESVKIKLLVKLIPSPKLWRIPVVWGCCWFFCKGGELRSDHPTTLHLLTWLCSMMLLNTWNSLSTVGGRKAADAGAPCIKAVRHHNPHSSGRILAWFSGCLRARPAQRQKKRSEKGIHRLHPS